MENFVFGLFTAWFFLSLIISLGNDLGKQESNWDDWFILVVCFPMVVFYYLPALIVHFVKRYRKLKSKRK